MHRVFTLFTEDIIYLSLRVSVAFLTTLAPIPEATENKFEYDKRVTLT